jgi:hypothetical protein
VRQQGQDWKLPENHTECDESARLSSGSEKEAQSRAELCHVTEGVEVWNEVGSWEREIVHSMDGVRQMRQQVSTVLLFSNGLYLAGPTVGSLGADGDPKTAQVPSRWRGSTACILVVHSADSGDLALAPAPVLDASYLGALLPSSCHVSGCNKRREGRHQAARDCHIPASRC